MFIMLTDVRMPGLDGIGVVHHIRGSEKKATPVMGISGTPWNIEDADFDVILEKPISIKSLVEQVVLLGQKEELPARK